MTLEALGVELAAFFQARARAGLAARDHEPHLSPPPELDARHGDLFRPEAREAVVRADLDPWARGRWLRLVEEGQARRAAAESRRELAMLLARLAGRLGAALGAGDMAAAGELAAEVMARQDAIRPPPPAPAATRALAGRVAAAGEKKASMPRSLPGEALAGALPAAGLADLWRGLVTAGRYLRRGDGQVRVQAGGRAGCHPLRVPEETVLTLPAAGGLEAYTAVLAAAGEALAWAHLPARLQAADRLLPGDAGAGIYGRLLSRRLAEPEWLAARGLAGSTLQAVAHGARALRRQRLAATAAAVASGGPDPQAAACLALAGWRSEAAVAVVRACGAPPAGEALEAERLAARLDHFLRHKYGRRWDGSPRAASLLRDLWSVGWGRPTAELLSFVCEEDPDGEVLIEELQS